jgi:hypothetical protein
VNIDQTHLHAPGLSSQNDCVLGTGRGVSEVSVRDMIRLGRQEQ